MTPSLSPDSPHISPANRSMLIRGRVLVRGRSNMRYNQIAIDCHTQAGVRVSNRIVLCIHTESSRDVDRITTFSGRRLKVHSNRKAEDQASLMDSEPKILVVCLVTMTLWRATSTTTSTSKRLQDLLPSKYFTTPPLSLGRELSHVELRAVLSTLKAPNTMTILSRLVSSTA